MHDMSYAAASLLMAFTAVMKPSYSDCSLSSKSLIRLSHAGFQIFSSTCNRFTYMCIPEVSITLSNACNYVSLTCYSLQVGHNPSALDFLADVANSAGNHVAGETSRGTAAAAVSAGVQPINGILKVRQNCYSW